MPKQIELIREVEEAGCLLASGVSALHFGPGKPTMKMVECAKELDCYIQSFARAIIAQVRSECAPSGKFHTVAEEWDAKTQ